MKVIGHQAICQEFYPIIKASSYKGPALVMIIYFRGVIRGQKVFFEIIKEGLVILVVNENIALLNAAIINMVNPVFFIGFS